MPNWCDNVLEVTGPEEVLARFVEATTTDSEGQNLLFELLVPEPPEERENNWPLGWRVESGWGTKWDLDGDDCGFAREPGFAGWSFMTAWSPPLLWVERVAAMFPELTFRLGYEEGGMDFCGVQRFTDGEHTVEGSWELSESITTVKCFVPSCEEYLQDVGVSVMDFDAAPDLRAAPFVLFCGDHELEEAVHEVNTRVAAG
jgi:hypothetical protein